MRINFSGVLVLLSMFLFSNSTIYAQSSLVILSNEEIGSIDCSYLKLSNSVNNTVEYSIQLIYKNQKYIYKQDVDTIILHNVASCKQLVNDLKASLVVIDDENKDIFISNQMYTIEKNKGYTDNKTLVFINKDKNINCPINKYFVNQLIDWLNGIEFGKG